MFKEAYLESQISVSHNVAGECCWYEDSKFLTPRHQSFLSYQR